MTVTRPNTTVKLHVHTDVTAAYEVIRAERQAVVCGFRLIKC